MEDDEEEDHEKSCISTVKCSLEKFCLDNVLRQILKEKAIAIHRLMVETLHLMGLELRFRFMNNIPQESQYNQRQILQFMYVATVIPGQKDSYIPEEILNVRDNIYLPLRKGLPLISRVGLPSNVLQEVANNILGSIKTNIWRHLFRRQLRFLCLRYGLNKK